MLYFTILYSVVFYNQFNMTNISTSLFHHFSLSLFLSFSLSLFLYFSICQRGNTALMVAACNGHTDVITYLLDNGANVNAINLVSECMCVCVGEERRGERRGEEVCMCKGGREGVSEGGRERGRMCVFVWERGEERGVCLY